MYDAMDQLEKTSWYFDYSDKKLVQRLGMLTERNEVMHLPGSEHDARTVAKWGALVVHVKARVERDVASPDYAARIGNALVLNNAHSALVEPNRIDTSNSKLVGS